MQDNLDERVKKLEKKMAKRKIVQFKKGDAPSPGRSDDLGRPFLLKLPVSVTLPATGSRSVRLGLSCNLPCFVCREDFVKVFAPGQELEVTLKNHDLASPLVLGQGEVVARCFLLDSTELEIVGD